MLFSETACAATDLVGQNLNQPGIKNGMKEIFGVKEVLVLFCRGRLSEEYTCNEMGQWTPSESRSCIPSSKIQQRPNITAVFRLQTHKLGFNCIDNTVGIIID